MKAYRVINDKGEFIKTHNGRSIWFNLGGIKSSINYQTKYWKSTFYDGCTIVEYDLQETGKKLSIEDFKNGGEIK